MHFDIYVLERQRSWGHKLDFLSQPFSNKNCIIPDFFPISAVCFQYIQLDFKFGSQQFYMALFSLK